MKHIPITTIAAVLLAGCTNSTSQDQSIEKNQIIDKQGSFIFKPKGDHKAIRVWYYKPPSYNALTPVVFVMHGMKRNGESYLKSWIPLAREGDFFLIVPEFSTNAYPHSSGYNQGNMYSRNGNKRNEAYWSFTVIENLFDYITTSTKSKVENYSIYGHSAGAQFVHRLVMFKPNARIQTAIAANAGWYTMPTYDEGFPYGLEGTSLNERSLNHSFGKNLIILLGSNDTDENHVYLRKTKEAMNQGRHRFERGQKFFEVANYFANKKNMKINWQLKTVPNVGHSNSKMSRHAVKCLK